MSRESQALPLELTLSGSTRSALAQESGPASPTLADVALDDELDAARQLRVETITDPGRFAGLREGWRRLQEAGDAGPFNAWEWLYPWYRRCGGDRQLRILAAYHRRTGELVGLLPLSLQTRSLLGRRVRVLRYLADAQAGSDYLDLMTARGRRSVVTRAFTQALRQSAGDWDVLDLRDMDERSDTLHAFEAAFRGSHDTQQSDASCCPWTALDSAESFDGFLYRTSRRHNYLRRLRWLRKQPGFRIEITTDPRELARPMSEFFRLHQLRWRGHGGSGAIDDAASEAFHRDATHLFAERGELRLYTLWLGEQALASVYAIVSNGTFHYYQSGYDPAWSNRSVGLVLIGATFEDAIELGQREYDFLRGEEPYKMDWTDRKRRTRRLRITARSGAGAWYRRWEDGKTTLRRAAKKALPASVVAAGQRMLR